MPSESSSLQGTALAKTGTPGGRTESEVRHFSGEDHLAFWAGLEFDSFVYVIRAQGDDPIKIGRAIDVRKRVAGLQTGNPRPLELLYVLPGDSELEWQLHYRLRHCLMLGEWFAGDEIPAFLEFTADLADWLVAGQRDSGEFLNFRRFRDGWSFRRPGSSPTTIRFTDPDPAALGRAAALREGEANPEPYVAPERDKAHFAAAHSHPAFQPHGKRR